MSVPPRVGPGKVVILAIFLLAAAMGGYAWWHQFQQGRRAQQFWGSQAALLIRYAPRVELLRLAAPEEGPGEPGDGVRLAGRAWRVERRADITRIPGLVNARHALTQDASFVWEGAPEPCRHDWTFALQFSDEGRQQQATIAFEPQCGRVRRVGGQGEARLAPHVGQAFARKADDWAAQTAEARDGPSD